MGEPKIENLLSNNKNNINWCYTDPSDKVIVSGDNLLHLAARTRSTETFLSIFKKSVENDIHLLEYNENHENPFHIAAKFKILPNVVSRIFEYLNSEKVTKEKSESFKSYVRNALSNRCALNIRKMTPLDMVSKEVREEVREIAGIKKSFLCNRKFHLCLYIIGAIACIAALCLSLYFLYMVSQSLALASAATIASGGAACLSFKAFGEIYDLNDASTLMEGISTEMASRYTGPI
ncbi:hypothetical protein [Wolbachia endosymbiont of Ctenocephalides felis wCfeJ]|uniref:hypothetical protein n=1 Tax=Wolbachia endosymbiont of Ctenocephalides felis wCfeJ TaxID=2732594 RepID=UPI001447B068|nr:hypothetical protein [Wolbachia endosymbiont of Ctenocephalides felis wCfeJ]WCR57861.1 MAG: hypothetical protein PG980_000333 [Wolbachia endosymbiont of Ctenocephalides felis wCfeJ]